jgi:hypothetical protein
LKRSLASGSEDPLEEHRRYFGDRGYDGRLIERGPLLSDDGMEWAGVAILVELPDRNAGDTSCSTTLRAGRAVRDRRDPRLAVRRPP